MSDQNKIEELRKAVTRNAFLTPEDSSRVADAIISAIRANSTPREIICTRCGIREQKGEQPKAEF